MISCNLNRSAIQWRQLLPALGYSLLLQAFFWAIHGPLTQLSKLPIDQVISSYEVAEISSPNVIELQGAEFKTIQSGTELYRRAPFYFAVKIPLELETHPDADLGLGVSLGGDNHHIFLNGYPIHTPGTLEFPATYHAMDFRLVKIPVGLLRKGENELIAITAKNGQPYQMFRGSIIGDYKALQKATARRQFLVRDYRRLTAVLAAVFAVTIFVLLPQTANRAPFYWLGALSLFIAARTTFFFYFGSFGAEINRLMLYFSATIGISLAWLCYVRAWASCSVIISRGAMVAAGLLIMLMWLLMVLDLYQNYDVIELLTNLFMFLCTTIALCILVYRLVFKEEERRMEFAVLSLGISLTFLDAVGHQFYQVDFGYQRLVGPVILFMILVTILSRNIRVFETMGDYAQNLNKQLAKKEETIKANFEALQYAETQRSIALERQRILRDMHDGIGSQLTGMIIQMRNQSLSYEDTRLGLESAFADLRLIVESLDSVGSSFEEQMRALGERIRRPVEAASFKMVWTCTPPRRRIFSQNEILQISRIIQEGITNALRHSKGAHISVGMEPSVADGQYVISIVDDGSNRPRPPKGRVPRGLNSINTRAFQLGGAANFDFDADGHSLTVTLPDDDPQAN